MKGLFVIGTDTGVGKTLVATSLVRRWVAQGHRVAVCKPCETGEGNDAEQLGRAVGRPLSRALVNPYRFMLPAAPAIAARREGTALQLDTIVSAVRTLAAEADRVIVEGAGGLLVPFTPTATCADLIEQLGLPVLLVARTALGTINHTLLTVEALRTRRIPLVGVVFSRSTGVEGPEEAESMALCAQIGGFVVHGVVPALGRTEPHDACADALDCDALWRATA